MKKAILYFRVSSETKNLSGKEQLSLLEKIKEISKHSKGVVIGDVGMRNFTPKKNN